MLMSVFCSVVKWDFDQVVVMSTSCSDNCSTFFAWRLIGILQWMPLGYWSPWWCQHIHPVPQFSSIGTASKNHFTNGLWCTNSVIINNRDYECDLLDLFEWNFKRERFIVIRIQSTFFDARFLLLYPFSCWNIMKRDMSNTSLSESRMINWRNEKIESREERRVRID